MLGIGTIQPHTNTRIEEFLKNDKENVQNIDTDQNIKKIKKEETENLTNS